MAADPLIEVIISDLLDAGAHQGRHAVGEARALEGGPISVMADRRRIVQVLNNLLFQRR